MSDEHEDIDARVMANLRAVEQRGFEPQFQSPRPDVPPLRIHHLLVCAVVAAVLLSFSRFVVVRYPQQGLGMAGVRGFSQVLLAIGLTIAGFSIYWWRLGYAAFSQPGQVLLLQWLGVLALTLASAVMTYWMFNVGGGLRSNRSAYSFTTIYSWSSMLFGVLLPLVFYLWCAWKVADTGPWRVLFILTAVTAFFTSTMLFLVVQRTMALTPSNIKFVYGVPYLLRGSSLFAVGVLAIVTDLAARRPRSWTHWAGVILWMFGQMSTLFFGLYYLFFWNIGQ